MYYGYYVLTIFSIEYIDKLIDIKSVQLLVYVYSKDDVSFPFLLFYNM